MFGTVLDKRRGWTIHAASSNNKFREVYQQLQALIKTHDENFHYTTINVNRSITCKNHIDQSNVGDPIIVGLGDYEGGNFVIGKNCKPWLGSNPPKVPICRHETKYDIKRKFVRFCVKSQRHAREQFQGNRFSIVYFTAFTKERQELIEDMAKVLNAGDNLSHT